MRLAQGGDASAYRRLLNEITPAIKSFLRTRFFHHDHVEDILQEILLAIHAARHTYRPEQPFQHWMYGIARHKMIDYFRRQMRKNTNEVNDEELVTFLEDPANNPEDALVREDIDKALQKLPRKQRAVVLLTKVEGYSMAEVAAKMGMSEAAVKVTAHRGYQKLKEWLIVYGYR